MSKAIEKARNLYISTFIPNLVEPIEERWISRYLGIYMQKNVKGIVFSDFKNKLQKVRLLGSDSVVQSVLPDNEQVKIERSAAVYLNLLPFAHLSEAPQGTNWNPVEGDEMPITDEGSEVYDMILVDRSAIGILRTIRRRYFIDPETGLPTKVEVCSKSSENDEYTLLSEIVVKEIEDSEMQAAIDIAFP
jgi:hypothetical protein